MSTVSVHGVSAGSENRMRADLHVDTLWRLEEKGGGLTPDRDDLQIDANRCQDL